MNIMVTYLAQARPAAGTAQETIVLHERACITDLLGKLAEVHGLRLRQLLLTAEGQPHPSLLLFMDDCQVHDVGSRRLCDADEVIVLPPMAGG